MINIPVSKAPYKRGYHHTKKRGRESTVLCAYCGRKVPRYKCITKAVGFRITDPLLRKEIGRQNIHTLNKKQYICPQCARHHRIVRRR